MTPNQHNNKVLPIDEYYIDIQKDGNDIKLLSQEEIDNCPFPGLRPFRTSEFQLFRGRNIQTEELINRLKGHRFLAVLGSSGTGKSSLVRAGLLPELLAGRIDGYDWNVAICRPGSSPLKNLSFALSWIACKNASNTVEPEELVNKSEIIEPLLH